MASNEDPEFLVRVFQCKLSGPVVQHGGFVWSVARSRRSHTVSEVAEEEEEKKRPTWNMWPVVDCLFTMFRLETREDPATSCKELHKKKGYIHAPVKRAPKKRGNPLRVNKTRQSTQDAARANSF